MTTRPSALLDSNVVVAIVATDHEHHVPSAALMLETDTGSFVVAAHSYAEAYSNLTRQGSGGAFRWTPQEALGAIERVMSVTRLVGLSPAQIIDTIRAYAGKGGIGPRLYDRLIGETAVQLGIPRIITWNVTHFRGLFPDLEVLDPAAFPRAD